MSFAHPKHVELRNLIQSMEEGSISAAVIERIEDLVRNDKAMLQHYIEYMRLISDLHFGLSGCRSQNVLARLFDLDRESETANHSPVFAPIGLPPASSYVPNIFNTAYHGAVGFFSQEILFAILVTTFIMGVAGVIGWNITKEHYTQLPWQSVASVERTYVAPETAPEATEKPAASTKQEKAFVFVGRITGMVDCRWADPGRTFSSSTDYSVALHDKYSLTSGLMEITYNTGAKVILQGPCTYEVDSADGGYLSLGKLTARVENKGARGGGRGTGEQVASSKNADPEIPKSRNPEIPKSPLRLPPHAPHPPPPSSPSAHPPPSSPTWARSSASMWTKSGRRK